MKKQIIFLILSIAGIIGHAQVGIGTIVPEAQLDIKSSNQATPSNNDGILIPKIDEFPVTNPTTAKDGLLVYVSGNGSISKGYYYWDDAAAGWVSIGTAADDIDFYEEGTTSAPNDINDDMYTLGNLAIGKTVADYKLDIEEDAGGRGAYIHITGTTDAETYGLLSEFSNSGNGGHVGVFSRLLGNGNGHHRGFWGILDGSGSGTHSGSYITTSGNGSGQTRAYVASMSGSGGGSQRGTFVNIANTGDGNHYGGINYLQGDGDGLQLGLYNLMQGDGAGDHYGVWSDIQGTGGGIQYGTRSVITNTGNGDHMGTYNTLSGIGTGTQYGFRSAITNTGSGIHTGTQNTLSGTGTGTQYGINTLIDNSGNGSHLGALSTLSGSGSGTHTGYQASMSGNGSGFTRGFVAGLSGSGGGELRGVYVSIGNTGDGWHSGTLNNLSGDGNGTRVGVYNVLEGNGTNTHYGVRNDILGTGTGTQVGSRHRMFNTGSGTHYGVYTTLLGTGSGIQYGVSNEITNSSNGIHYGVNNTLSGTGSGPKYGSYNLISTSAGGTQYGVYSDVQKAGSYAGYFLGDVAVDVNALFVDASAGQVGIGTTTPGRPLDVVGRMRVRNSGSTAGIWYTDGVNERQFAGVRTHSATGTLQKWGVYNNSSWRFIVQGNGRVGIGTQNPAYALDVVGDINTSGNIRRSGGAYSFPDYVFESYFDGASDYNDTYELKSLEEIESFLKKNKHLPGVQSRADVEASGWNVTEGVRINLEKVEELYLYTIEANKKIEKVTNENQLLKLQLDKQQTEIDTLKKEVSEIKALVKNKFLKY